MSYKVLNQTGFFFYVCLVNVSNRGRTNRLGLQAYKSEENFMNYVDGFVAAVPTANRDAYIKHAEQAAKVFIEFGALNVAECWGDDVSPGKLTSFPQAVMCKEDETVVFSWITWPSKAVRDAAWPKMMEDPRFDPEKNPMPFDASRMIYGGFTNLFVAP